MRNAETILDIIRERGRRKAAAGGHLSTTLQSLTFIFAAYSRLYRNHGAMTPGATDETVDGMALTKIDAIITTFLREKLRDNRFLRLLSNLFKAGYLEDWKSHESLSGVPQGSVGRSNFEQYLS